jgi:hypothetical protein
MKSKNGCVTELPDLRRSLKAIWLNDLPLKPIPRAFLDLLAQRYPQLHIPDTREALPNAKLDQGVAA